jgi:hypothetical protein
MRRFDGGEHRAPRFTPRPSPFCRGSVAFASHTAATVSARLRACFAVRGWRGAVVYESAPRALSSAGLITHGAKLTPIEQRLNLPSNRACERGRRTTMARRLHNLCRARTRSAVASRHGGGRRSCS